MESWRGNNLWLGPSKGWIEVGWRLSTMFSTWAVGPAQLVPMLTLLLPNCITWLVFIFWCLSFLLSTVDMIQIVSTSMIIMNRFWHVVNHSLSSSHHLLLLFFFTKSINRKETPGALRDLVFKCKRTITSLLSLLKTIKLKFMCQALDTLLDLIIITILKIKKITLKYQ